MTEPTVPFTTWASAEIDRFEVRVSETLKSKKALATRTRAKMSRVERPPRRGVEKAVMIDGHRTRA